MNTLYTFPVTNPIHARNVTEPTFEPDLFDDNRQLYVDLDEVRGAKFRDKIRFSLGIDTDTGRLDTVTNDYTKVVFYGHRGCGKTTELRRLHSELHDPTRYFSVFLSLEDEVELGSFQAVDLFVWIILLLVRTAKDAGLEVGTAAFDQLTRQLLEDKEVEREVKHTLGGEVGAETEGGFSFFGLFSAKGTAKATLASENATSTKIRQEVRRNTLGVIGQLNDALALARHAIQAQGKGRDLLFIVDGSEKIRLDIYKWLFVENPSLLESLNVNMVLSVPINAAYQMEASPANFQNRQLLPMIVLDAANPEARANCCFREVIERRIDVSRFLAPGVLDRCVALSGGCMRQLLIIVNAVIREALGRLASLQTAETAFYEEGRRLYESIPSEQLRLLEKGPAHWHTADAPVREMLFFLVLLKYNGRIEINPLLRPFLKLTSADGQPAA